jgi:hypothetical protein
MERNIKRWFILFLLIETTNTFKTYSQDNSSRMNLVISIDDEIVIGDIAKLRLTAFQKKAASKIINANYLPGSLYFNKVELDNANEDSVFISFDFYYFEGDKQEVKNYSIQLKRNWFNYSYFVLRIYNIDRKRNKNHFVAASKEGYVYEYDTPNGSVKRVRREGK